MTIAKYNELKFKNMQLKHQNMKKKKGNLLIYHLHKFEAIIGSYY